MFRRIVLGGLAAVTLSAAAVVVVNRRHIWGVGLGFQPHDSYPSGLDFVR
jgi:hypothetical protein